MTKLTLYHGTPDKIVVPQYGLGDAKHDYGMGFYFDIHIFHKIALWGKFFM